jgi:hypothetical protein
MDAFRHEALWNASVIATSGNSADLISWIEPAAGARFVIRFPLNEVKVLRVSSL